MIYIAVSPRQDHPMGCRRGAMRNFLRSLSCDQAHLKTRARQAHLRARCPARRRRLQLQALYDSLQRRRWELSQLWQAARHKALAPAWKESASRISSELLCVPSRPGSASFVPRRTQTPVCSVARTTRRGTQCAWHRAGALRTTPRASKLRAADQEHGYEKQMQGNGFS